MPASETMAWIRPGEKPRCSPRPSWRALMSWLRSSGCFCSTRAAKKSSRRSSRNAPHHQPEQGRGQSAPQQGGQQEAAGRAGLPEVVGGHQHRQHDGDAGQGQQRSFEDLVTAPSAAHVVQRLQQQRIGFRRLHGISFPYFGGRHTIWFHRRKNHSADTHARKATNSIGEFQNSYAVFRPHPVLAGDLARQLVRLVHVEVDAARSPRPAPAGWPGWSPGRPVRSPPPGRGTPSSGSPAPCRRRSAWR